MLDHVSHSSLSDLDQCERYYQLKRVDLVRPKKTPVYFAVGRAVHKGIECIVKGLPAKTAILNEFKALDLKQMTPDELVKLETDKAMSVALAEAWGRHFKQLLRCKTLSEESIRISIGRGLPDYLGILDLLVKDKDGWWIIDIKTAQSPQASFFDALHVGHQFVSYMFLARKLLGEWPKGVRIHVLSKPTIKIKQKETATQYIARAIKWIADKPDAIAVETIRYTKVKLTQWQLDVRKKIAQVMVIHQSPNTIRPQSTGNCNKGFTSCEFLPICRKGLVSMLQFDKGPKKDDTDTTNKLKKKNKASRSA